MQLAWQLQKSGEYLAALDWFQTVYAYNFSDKPDTTFDDRKIYYGLQLETNVAPRLSRSDHWLAEELNPHALAASRIRPDSNPNSHTRYTLMSLARCLMDFADSEFTRDTPESLARARALYLTARRLLLSPDLARPTDIPPDATLLPNPLLELLRMRVEIQLTKMRQGRNIAGMKRQVELPVSLPPGPDDLPTIGRGRSTHHPRRPASPAAHAILLPGADGTQQATRQHRPADRSRVPGGAGEARRGELQPAESQQRSAAGLKGEELQTGAFTKRRRAWEWRMRSSACPGDERAVQEVEQYRAEQL